jgi:hypothetical protein
MNCLSQGLKCQGFDFVQKMWLHNNMLINSNEFPQGQKAFETAINEPQKDFSRYNSILKQFFGEFRTPNGYKINVDANQFEGKVNEIKADPEAYKQLLNSILKNQTKEEIATLFPIGFEEKILDFYRVLRARVAIYTMQKDQVKSKILFAAPLLNSGFLLALNLVIGEEDIALKVMSFGVSGIIQIALINKITSLCELEFRKDTNVIYGLLCENILSTMLKELSNADSTASKILNRVQAQNLENLK